MFWFITPRVIVLSGVFTVRTPANRHGGGHAVEEMTVLVDEIFHVDRRFYNITNFRVNEIHGIRVDVDGLAPIRAIKRRASKTVDNHTIRELASIYAVMEIFALPVHGRKLKKDVP